MKKLVNHIKTKIITRRMRVILRYEAEEEALMPSPRDYSVALSHNTIC